MTEQTQSHGLGRLPAMDGRDQGYLMREVVFPQLAPKPRIRPYKLGPTLDQGNAPHCVGFSCRDKLATAPIMVPDLKGPTPQDIYFAAQTIDEWPGEDYDGTSVRAGFKYLRSQGYFQSYVWASSVTDCERFIRGGYGTIVLGTSWYRGMFKPDASGFVHLTGPIDGGHAYHLFWMDPEKREAWCKNSWGNNWGIKLAGRHGCFKLSYTALDLLLADDGEAGSALEVKVK